MEIGTFYNTVDMALKCQVLIIQYSKAFYNSRGFSGFLACFQLYSFDRRGTEIIPFLDSQYFGLSGLSLSLLLDIQALTSSRHLIGDSSMLAML